MTEITLDRVRLSSSKRQSVRLLLRTVDTPGVPWPRVYDIAGGTHVGGDPFPVFLTHFVFILWTFVSQFLRSPREALGEIGPHFRRELCQNFNFNTETISSALISQLP